MNEQNNQRIVIGLVVLAALLVLSWQAAGYLTGRLGNKSSLDNLSLEQPFVLKKGNTATIAGKKLTITFDEISEDSRCPEITSCVWEGQAVVKAKVNLDGEANSLDFISRPGEQQSVAVQQVKDYTIRLQKLDPYPSKKDQSINKQKYQATFIVSSMK